MGQAEAVKTRAAFYVDGFNLYHAIADLNEPFLKWCDLWKLAETLLPKRSEALSKVVYCTAFYPGSESKRWRHDQYVQALRLVGVECILGHYVHDSMACRSCGSEWSKPTEKETDINLALSLYRDAMTDQYDKAYLLTADSDQAATLKFLKLDFPRKSLVTAAPPGRNFSSHLAKLSDGGRIALNREHLERSLLSAQVFSPGEAIARRPREYAPPPRWVPPEKRPQS